MKTLIVDDDPSICQCLIRLTQHLGYREVDTVHSGEKALVQAVLHEYDLITLDLQMPGGVNGMALVAPLRRRFSHTILAIISGYIPQDLSNEVARKVDVMLPKPIDLDAFVQLLEKAEEVHQTRKKIAELGTVLVGAS